MASPSPINNSSPFTTPQYSKQTTPTIFKITTKQLKYLLINMISIVKYKLTKSAYILYQPPRDQKLDITIYLLIRKQHQLFLDQFKASVGQFNISVEQIESESFEKNQQNQKVIQYKTIKQFCQLIFFNKQESIVFKLDDCSADQKSFIFSEINVLKEIQIQTQQLQSKYISLTLTNSQSHYSQTFDDEVPLQKMIVSTCCFIKLINNRGQIIDNFNTDLLINMIEAEDQVHIKHVKLCCDLVNDSIHCYIEVKFKKTKDDLAFIKRITTQINRICTYVENVKEQSNIINIYQDPNEKMKQIQENYNYLQKQQENTKYSDKYGLNNRKIQIQNIVRRIYDNCDIHTLKSYWNGHLRSFLTQIHKQWDMHWFQYEDLIKKLIRYLSYVLQKYKYRIPTEKNKAASYQNAKFFNIADILCPDMVNIVNSFEKKIGKTSLKKRIKEKINKFYNKKDLTYQDKSQICLKQREMIQQCLQEIQSQLQIRRNVIDKLIYNFFKQTQENNTIDIKKGYQFVYVLAPNGNKIPLKKFISQLIMFQRNSKQWIDIFKLIHANIKVHNGKNLVQTNNFSKLQYERLPNTNCLGCTTFFQADMDFNNENDVNVNVKVFDMASKLGDYEVKIKQQICNMLNNHGGIILFDCVKECSGFYPKGTLINEKDKEMIENKISSWMASIHPKIQIKRNIHLSFVPVYANSRFQRGGSKKTNNSKLIPYSGHESLRKLNQVYYNQNLQEGIYVFRIKVTPHDQKLYYFWSNTEKENQNYFIYEPNNEKKNQIRHLHKLIKNKFKRFSQQDDQNNIFAANSALNPLNHVCSQPEGGFKTSKKNHDGSTKSGRQAQTLETRYKHMTLVFTKHCNMQKVKSRLAAKDIKCEYQQKFHNRTINPLKSSLFTSILYHNEKFQYIFTTVHNHVNFTFEGKPIILVAITNFIKIDHQPIFTKEQFQFLCQWVKMQFPDEILEVFQFTNHNKKEYYIKSQSKVSTVLLYYVLKQHSLKVSIKNPMHFDRLNAEQKAKVWRKIYSNDRQSKPESVLIQLNNEEQIQFDLQEQNHFIRPPVSSISIIQQQIVQQQLLNVNNSAEYQALYKQLLQNDYESYYLQNQSVNLKNNKK